MRAPLIHYLSVVPLGYAGLAVFMLVTSSLNGIDRPFQSAGLNGGRLILVLIPFTYLGSLWWGYEGILWGMALANFLGGIVAYLWIRVCCGRVGTIPRTVVAQEATIPHDDVSF